MNDSSTTPGLPVWARPLRRRAWTERFGPSGRRWFLVLGRSRRWTLMLQRRGDTSEDPWAPENRAETRAKLARRYANLPERPK